MIVFSIVLLIVCTITAAAAFYAGWYRGCNNAARQARIKTLELELETLRMQLAAVCVAVEGNFKGCKKQWRSTALDAVLALRKELDAAKACLPHT